MPTARFVRVTTDDDRVAAYIRTSYGDVLTREPPPEHLVDDGMLLTATTPATVEFNGVALPREGPPAGKNPWTSGGYIVDQFVWRAIASDPDWFSVYACAVDIAGRAVVFAGPGGVGKTTLALALALTGARVYGDEVVLVHRRHALVSAIPRRLMIRNGSLPLLAAPAFEARIRAAGTVLGEGADAFLAFDRNALGPLPPPAPLAALLVVERGDGPALTPLSPARAAVAAAPYLGTRSRGFETFAAFAAALAGAPCYRLALGDPGATAAAVREAARA